MSLRVGVGGSGYVYLIQTLTGLFVRGLDTGGVTTVRISLSS